MTFLCIILIAFVVTCLIVVILSWFAVKLEEKANRAHQEWDDRQDDQ